MHRLASEAALAIGSLAQRNLLVLDEVSYKRISRPPISDSSPVSQHCIHSAQRNAAACNGRGARMNIQEKRGPETPSGSAGVEEKVGSAIDSVQQGIRDFAEQQKALGARQVEGVARAVHQAAREVEEQMPRVAETARRAAAGLDAVGTSLRDQSLDQLVTTFNNVARTRPLAVFGSAVVAGFVLSRFLKSSAKQDENPARSS